MDQYIYDPSTGTSKRMSDIVRELSLNKGSTSSGAGISFPINTSVLDGDSITAQDQVSVVGTNGIESKHYTDRGYFGWMNRQLGQSFTLLKNAAVGGQRSDQVLARIKDVLALKAQFGLLMVGVNDNSQGKSAEFTLNNVKEYVRQMQENGTRMVVSTSTPTVKWTTQDQKTQYYRYNRMLKEWARTQPNLILLDMGSAYLIPDGTAAAVNHTNDDTHPSALGAIKMGNIAATEMIKHISLVPSTLSRSKDDPENLIINGVLFGTAGTIATPATVSGVVPDKWILGGYVTGTTVVGSKVANVDYQGDHFHVSHTGGTAAGSSLLYCEISPTTQPLTPWAVGDWVCGQMEVEFDQVANSDVQLIEFGLEYRTNGVSVPVASSYGMFHESSTLNLAYTPKGKLMLKTPTFKIPPGVDRMRMNLRITGLKAEYNVYLAEIRKV